MCDRALRPLAIDPPRRGGGDPERGDGALDRLARSRGARSHAISSFPRPTSRGCRGKRSWPITSRDRRTIVACNDAGDAVGAGTPRPQGGPKIFVIGLPKTGTTSLHRAFELLGLRSFHWGGSRAYQAVLQSLRDGERLLERTRRALRRVLRHRDALGTVRSCRPAIPGFAVHLHRPRCRRLDRQPAPPCRAQRAGPARRHVRRVATSASMRTRGERTGSRNATG